MTAAELTPRQARALADLAAAPDGLRYSSRTGPGHIYWSHADRLAELGYARNSYGVERTVVRITDAGRQALAAIQEASR